MAKLKCVSHNRRVHVLKGAVTVHREDGSKCVVNPLVRIMGNTYTPNIITSMPFSWQNYWMTGSDIQEHYSRME